MSSEAEKLGQLLSAYLDGELSRKDARRIEQALKTDRELAEKLDSLRWLRQAVRTLPRESAPVGMVERVLARAERNWLLSESPPAAARARGWWVGRLAAAAVVLIAVGVGVVVVSELGRPSGRQEAGVGPEGPDLAAGEKAPPADGKRVAEAKLHDRSGAPPARPGGPGAPEPTPAKPATPPVAVAAVNFFINTKPDEMTQVQAGVQRVLETNGIQEIALAKDVTRAAKAMGRGGPYYSQYRPAPEQVKFKVVITRPQLRKIVNDLNGIRLRQEVRQVPLVEMVSADLLGSGEAELALADSPRGFARAAGKESVRREARPGKGGPRPPGEPAAEELPDAGPGQAGKKADAPKDQTRGQLPAGIAAAARDGRETHKPPTTAPASPPAQAGAGASQPAVATAEAPRAKVLAAELTQPAPRSLPADALTMPAWQIAARQQRQALERYLTANVMELEIILNAVAEDGAKIKAADKPTLRE